MPPYRVLLVLALAACAGSLPEQPAPGAAPSAERGALGRLPATYRNAPSCPGCLALTLTLRADGAYLARERLGSSEFYDFGRWRESREDAVLHLDGGRDAPRRYAIRSADLLEAQPVAQGSDLKRAPEVEILRGPFRMVGLFDGKVFKECQTGLAWVLDDSRAAQALRETYLQRQNQALLVSVDARFEPQARGEALRVVRTAAIHNERGCPG